MSIEATIERVLKCVVKYVSLNNKGNITKNDDEDVTLYSYDFRLTRKNIVS